MTQSGSNVGKVVSFANGEITGYKDYTANTSVNGSENYFYKLDGRIAATITGNGETALYTDLSLLAPGMYLLSVNGRPAHKLVKQ